MDPRTVAQHVESLSKDDIGLEELVTTIRTRAGQELSSSWRARDPECRGLMQKRDKQQEENDLEVIITEQMEEKQSTAYNKRWRENSTI